MDAEIDGWQWLLPKELIFKYLSLQATLARMALCFRKWKLCLCSSSSLEEASARLFLSLSSSTLESMQDIYCSVIVQFRKCVMVGGTESISVQFCNINIKASSLQLSKRRVPGPMLLVSLLYLWMWRSVLLQSISNCTRFTCLKCFFCGLFWSASVAALLFEPVMSVSSELSKLCCLLWQKWKKSW